MWSCLSTLRLVALFLNTLKWINHGLFSTNLFFVKGTTILACLIKCQIRLKRMKKISPARYICGKMTLSRNFNDASTVKSNLKLKAINLKNPKISFLPNFDLLFILKGGNCSEVSYYVMCSLDSLSRIAVSQNNCQQLSKCVTFGSKKRGNVLHGMGESLPATKGTWRQIDKYIFSACWTALVSKW